MPSQSQANLDKLKAKLRELFQLDRGDLDFGLYRIMAFKRDEVERFLDQDLLPQISESLAEIAAADTRQAEAELKQAKQQAKAMGVAEVEIPKLPKVRELADKLAAAQTNAQTEAATYNHLYNFFARYYSEGDFMSLRRYKGSGREAYAIPYNGEEVKLHWANADQYYIKTTENYAAYDFLVQKGESQVKVRFEIAAADNEKDHIKASSDKNCRFLLAKDFWAANEEQLSICFEHRPLKDNEKIQYPGNKQQREINADSEARILSQLGKHAKNWLRPLAALDPTDADQDRTVLARHLAAYTAKNQFDYFIHKDLGGFLRRELDAYLKAEVLSIDHLAIADDPAVLLRELAQIKAIKKVGEKIITFLAQLEDFQKQLWLKKKFVLETQYCVSLDKIPASFYPEIAKNSAQQTEWQNLFGISGKLTANQLKTHPHLLIDTCHFGADFCDQLLAALSQIAPLHQQLDGLLVHGENFQALNLLQAKYRGQVQCIYIDPPYNSPSSKILYKNDYEHSSWLALMAGRIEIAKNLQSSTGVLACAIDKNEERRLALVLEDLYPESNTVCISVVHNPRGVQGDGFSFVHESVYFVHPFGEKITHRKLHEEKEKPLLKTGKESSRHTAKSCFYPIYIKEGKIIGFGDVAADNFSPSQAFISLENGAIEVWPISTSDGQERKWRYARQSIEAVKENLSAKISKNGNVSIYLSKLSEPYRTVWSGAEFNAAEYGSNLLKGMGFGEIFTYPKSLLTVYHCLIASNVEKNSNVLDYFAGSGTTGHAVVNLNREDGGNRKYILVEMGHHFDSVLLPRMKKVAYAKHWKDGTPKNPENLGGISAFFQYVRLEGYEDTLDSLERTQNIPELLEKADKTVREEYQLRYALGHETEGSASLLGGDFSDPWAYQLSVVRDGVRRQVQVDLVETFNFLLGLKVHSRQHLDAVLVIRGETANGENCLILWRNTEKTDAAALDNWWQKHGTSLAAGFADDLHTIYTNGDHTLTACKQNHERWQAVTLDSVFRELMFGG